MKTVNLHIIIAGLLMFLNQNACFSQTNLILNGSLEQWTEDTIPFPVNFVRFGGTAANWKQSSDARTGDYSFHIYATSTHRRFNTIGYDLDAGSYVFKIWLKGEGLLRWVTLTKEGATPSGTKTTAGVNYHAQPMGGQTEAFVKNHETWTEYTIEFNNILGGKYCVHMSYAWTNTDDSSDKYFVIDDLSLVKQAENRLGNLTIHNQAIANPEAVPGFHPDVLEYNVLLPFHYDEISDGLPEINGVVEFCEFGVITEIVQITSLDGSISDRTATITIQDQSSSTRTYRVVFEKYDGFIYGGLYQNYGGFDSGYSPVFYFQNGDKVSHGEFWGDYAIRTQSAGSVAVTPALSNGAGTLTFWKRSLIAGNHNLIVSYSTASSGGDIHLKTISNEGLTTAWELETIVINSEDPTTRVKFSADRDPSCTSNCPNMYWDDVKITPYITVNHLNNKSLGKHNNAYVVGNTIKLAGNGKYNIFTIDGSLIYSEYVANYQTVPVEKGIYIVKAGTEVIKLVVP